MTAGDDERQRALAARGQAAQAAKELGVVEHRMMQQVVELVQQQYQPPAFGVHLGKQALQHERAKAIVLAHLVCLGQRRKL